MTPRLPDAASALTWGRLPTTADRAESVPTSREAALAARESERAARRATCLHVRVRYAGHEDGYLTHHIDGLGESIGFALCVTADQPDDPAEWIEVNFTDGAITIEPWED